MPNYRLSKRAKEDLIKIAEYTYKQFGVVQSNRYRDQLKQRFLIIAEQPLLFPVINHIRAGYRCSVCGTHSIYYRVKSNKVEIVRIIGRQDINKIL